MSWQHIKFYNLNYDYVLEHVSLIAARFLTLEEG